MIAKCTVAPDSSRETVAHVLTHMQHAPVTVSAMGELSDVVVMPYGWFRVIANVPTAEWDPAAPTDLARGRGLPPAVPRRASDRWLRWSLDCGGAGRDRRDRHLPAHRPGADLRRPDRLAQREPVHRPALLEQHAGARPARRRGRRADLRRHRAPHLRHRQRRQPGRPIAGRPSAERGGRTANSGRRSRSSRPRCPAGRTRGSGTSS